MTEVVVEFMEDDPEEDSVENDSDQATEESAHGGPGTFVAGVAIRHGDGDTAGSPDEGRDREHGATGSEYKRDHDKKRNKTHDCIRSNGRTNCLQASFSRDIRTMSPITRLYPASDGKTMEAPASVDMRMCDSQRRGAQGIDLRMHESSSAPFAELKTYAVAWRWATKLHRPLLGIHRIR